LPHLQQSRIILPNDQGNARTRRVTLLAFRPFVVVAHGASDKLTHGHILRVFQHCPSEQKGCRCHVARATALFERKVIARFRHAFGPLEQLVFGRGRRRILFPRRRLLGSRRGRGFFCRRVLPDPAVARASCALLPVYDLAVVVRLAVRSRFRHALAIRSGHCDLCTMSTFKKSVSLYRRLCRLSCESCGETRSKKEDKPHHTENAIYTMAPKRKSQTTRCRVSVCW